MSISGLTNEYNPPTLDGLTVIEADQLFVGGQEIDVTTLVPYTGATQTIELGSQNIRTLHIPVSGADLVNLTTLTNAVTFVDNANALTYLNKIIVSPQTVTGAITYSSGQTYSTSTGDTVAIFDGVKKLSSSNVTTIELGYLSGVTSSIQTQINGKASISYVDSQNASQNVIIVLKADTSTVNSQLALKADTSYVNSQDALRLLLTGGTMSGDVILGVNKITSTATPATNDTLTRKGYVDSAISTGLSSFLPLSGGTVTGVLSVINTLNVSIVGLNANIRENIKLISIANHYDGVNPSETFIFNGPNGYFMIGYNTVRNATTANLMLGVSSLNFSEILSVKSNGTGFLPLNFGASSYFFSGGNVGINQSNPQWKIHASNTNAWNASIGTYNGNQAQGILALGGKDNNSDYQYIIFPNPSISDGSVPGMHWWSSDIITGRYKNEFRVAWWKDTHGLPNGVVYKEGITMYLTDSGGFTSLDYIKLNGRTQISGILEVGGIDKFSIESFDNYRRIQSWNSKPLSINPLGNNVGIGTISPSFPLDVSGIIRAYSNAINGNSLIFSENASAGDAYAVMHLRNNSGNGCYWFMNSTTRVNDGGANVATLRNDIGALRLQSNNSNSGITIASGTGAVNIRGTVSYAVPNGHMASGSLTIGSTDQNYGGGNFWTSNTAALMMECLNDTEIAIHDSGARIASFMYYNGTANTISIGRDMGWGTTPVVFPNSVGIGSVNTFYKLFVDGTARVTGRTSLDGSVLITNPNNTITRLGEGDINYIRNNTLFDTNYVTIGNNYSFLFPLYVTATSNYYWFLRMYMSSGGVQMHNGAGTWPVSIWATGAIVTDYWFGTVSDERIKTNIKPVGDMLNIINQIQVVSFDFIDPVNNKRDECGVIAQQVEGIFPNIIDKSVGVIPNIMKPSSHFEKIDDSLKIFYTRGDSDDIIIGSKVKIILGSESLSKGEHIVTILEVGIDFIIVEWKLDTCLDALSIIVYGKEVNDFRNVDKDQFGIMAIKGIQEVSKQINGLQEQADLLQQRNKILEEHARHLEKVFADYKILTNARIDKLANLISQLINK